MTTAGLPAGFDEVEALVAMGFKRSQAVSMLRPCGPGTLEERIGEAVRRLQPDFVEPAKAVKQEAVQPAKTTGKIIRLEGIKLRDDPQIEEAPEDGTGQDGGPLEWLIRKASWCWHTWNDPIIRAKVQERDRLLSLRQGLLQSVKRWVHLVERAEKLDPTRATEALTEAVTLEAGIVQALIEANPSAATKSRRKKR
jgi:hypothetical protein